MASAVKRLLSGCTNGKAVLVAATATPGTTIHTAISGTTDGSYDEVWLWAQNNHTADVVLTLELGSTDAKDNIKVTIPHESGLIPILPGLIVQNSCVIKAFAATADVISVVGFVNRITD